MIPLFVDLPRSEDVVERTVKLLENVQQVQRNVLENLLEKHGACEYLQKYQMDGRIDIQTFKERVPIITYEDVDRDIQRVAQEEKNSNILSCEEVVHFHESGGTSGGKFKILPVTASAREGIADYLTTVEAWFRMTPLFQQTPTDGIGMTFLFSGGLNKTPGGLDIVQVSSCFLVTILATAVTFLKENWEELCTDIETGKLSSRITDSSVRRAVSEILNAPNLELASRIRAECCKDSWAGILIRLWPKLRYIAAIATGGMLRYVDQFEFFSDSKVPIVSLFYGSSEGCLGINPHPEAHPKDVTYFLLPQMGFYEFKRLKDSSVVEISDVIEGEDYELIYTNLSGLWRYRMGDVLKCVGYYHSSPEFQFVGRENVLVSVANEVVYEYEITRAVESAAKLHLSGARLMDYTTTVNVRSLPGHYVVFWELDVVQTTSEDEHKEELDQCCLAIENCLNDKYRRDRNLGTIAPMELVLVKPGSFSRLSQEAQASRCSNQLKQARTYKPGHPAIQVLYSNAQQKFRSSRLPSE